MNRQPGKKFLFILLLFIFACPGIKVGFPVPVGATGISPDETVSYKAQHIPNSELEGPHFHVAATSHIAFQKNQGQLHSSATCNFYKQASVQDQQIKESSFLIKDYLAHIYPSHNFW